MGIGLGPGLFAWALDHSAIFQFHRREPSFRKLFRQQFEEMVRQCVSYSLVSGRLAVTSSTHVNANAFQTSENLVEMREEPGTYWERLDAYETERLEELEQRTENGARNGQSKSRKITAGARRGTDARVPRWSYKTFWQAGGTHHLSHQTLDWDYGIIIGVTVSSVDAHNSAPYLKCLESIHENIIPIQATAADSAYDFTPGPSGIARK